MMTDEELDGMHVLLSVCPGSLDIVEMGKTLLAHIDEQANQIATLKAICIKERDRRMGCERETIEQLAQEYPEIFWR